MPRPETEFNCGKDVDVQDKARATGEQTFTLRAQDITSPKLICLWMAENIDTAPAEKLRHALEDALRMRIWPNRKRAD